MNTDNTYPETIQIDITQDDIDAANAWRKTRSTVEQVERDPHLWRLTCNCPVARAASRALGTPCASNSRNIHSPELGYGEDVSRFSYVLPDEAARFVLAYDDRRSVRPLSFVATKRPDDNRPRLI